jgi:hypothetical protein
LYLAPTLPVPGIVMKGFFLTSSTHSPLFFVSAFLGVPSLLLEVFSSQPLQLLSEGLMRQK